jgi:hypothetical protein
MQTSQDMFSGEKTPEKPGRKAKPVSLATVGPDSVVCTVNAGKRLGEGGQVFEGGDTFVATLARARQLIGSVTFNEPVERAEKTGMNRMVSGDSTFNRSLPAGRPAVDDWSTD